MQSRKRYPAGQALHPKIKNGKRKKGEGRGGENYEPIPQMDD